MCMIDLADPVEVCNLRESKARKHHRCDECGIVIHPGERYQSAFTVMEGDAATYRMCQLCMAGRDWLQRECNGYCFAYVLEDLRDHWWDDGIHTMELGRLIVGGRKREKIARLFSKGFVNHDSLGN